MLDVGKLLNLSFGRWSQIEIFLQLDWLWVAEWACAGIFAVAVQFQNRDKFIAFLIKKAGFVFFFEKSKNELVRPKMVFWQF